MTEYRTTLKVYLEDTDAQGIVFHANYLKFFERSRTDVIDRYGIGLARAQEQGIRFVVHEVKIKFQKPARLSEELVITTTWQRSSAYRLTFTQKALRKSDEALLTTATVEIVCIDNAGNLVELTRDMLAD